MLRMCVLIVLISLQACALTTSGRPDDVQSASAAPIILSGSSIRIGEVSQFTFADWPGKPISVWMYVPNALDYTTAPVLIMMHGAKRDSKRYLEEWLPLAKQGGFVVIAPQFTSDDYPKSDGYNLGNVFPRGQDAQNPEAIWSFSAIEPLFDSIVAALKSNQTQYTMYGHSAGSQFVHRFMYYKPDARVKRYIAANAGWYTLPLFDEPYPYGLKGSGVTPKARDRALAADLIVLLGNQDNDPAHESLRKTPEAMQQGQHRLARGGTFFEVGSGQAQQHGLPFGWQVAIVDGVAHSNSGMAAGAVKHIN